MMRPKHLLWAVLICVAAAVLNLASTRMSPKYPHVSVRLDGAFKVDGQYPGQPLENARHVRKWGSWAGDDANVGVLTFGPLTAPRVLHVAIGGYPQSKGIEVYLQRAGTNERHMVAIDFNVGERWQPLDIEVPGDWTGSQITLVAVDQAKETGGWVAITEPLRGVRGDGDRAFFITLAGWIFNGVLLGGLWLAAVRVVSARRWVPEPWVPLVGAGLVAMIGYVVFWAFFAHVVAGKIFSVGVLVVAAAILLRGRPSTDTGRGEFGTVGQLLLAIAFFYVVLLHLYPSSLGIYDLAANRFREGMPGDNTLPRNVSWDLICGRTLRWPADGWLSSDRPPLQSGWQLLTLTFTELAHIDELTSTCTAAIWLQATWILAAYGLLRTFRLSPRRACGWIAVLALSGFFIENTEFTWPKLSAAAFGCGAFALWLLRPAPTRAEVTIGACLAGLGWLSHGGVAFAYLALLPWVAFRVWRGPRPQWVGASLVFLALAVPWMCYQKFYSPPGNRLLKWHLAGQIEIDPRGTWVTIRDAYIHRGWVKWGETIKSNFNVQVSANWRSLFELSRTDAAIRRHNEFFYSTRALTWWCAGLLVLPVAWFRRRRDRDLIRAQASLLGWVLATVVVWCVLMYLPNEAVIHQGSYTTMLGAFVLLSAWLEAAWAWTLPIVAGLQTATMASTWAGPNTVVHGPATPLMLILLGCAGIVLAWYVIAAMIEVKSPRGAPRLRSAIPWLGGAAAFVPLLWCWHDFRALFWFGDEWDQLDQISRVGFWKWTIGAFGENFAPALKLTWGGVALATHGSYLALVIGVWAAHAACVVVLGRWLRQTGFTAASMAIVLAGFGLAATNIETLGWTIQLLTVQGMLFFVAAAQWQQHRDTTGWSTRAYALFSGLILISTFSFARGALVGIVLSLAALAPIRGTAPSARRSRVFVALIGFMAAAIAIGLVMTLAGGNQHHLAAAGIRAPAAYAAAYLSLNPFYDFTGLNDWSGHTAVLFGAMKLGILGLGWATASPTQRRLLWPLLLFDLGNAALLGIGRYHTGLGTVTSSRYQYISLLCTLPFVGAAFDGLLRRFSRTPSWAATIGVAGLIATILVAVSPWPGAMRDWADGRGRNTRHLIFVASAPPAEGAVPGIPNLPTQRARELAKRFTLH